MHLASHTDRARRKWEVGTASADVRERSDDGDAAAARMVLRLGASQPTSASPDGRARFTMVNLHMYGTAGARFGRVARIRSGSLAQSFRRLERWAQANQGGPGREKGRPAQASRAIVCYRHQSLETWTCDLDRDGGGRAAVVPGSEPASPAVHGAAVNGQRECRLPAATSSDSQGPTAAVQGDCDCSERGTRARRRAGKQAGWVKRWRAAWASGAPSGMQPFSTAYTVCPVLVPDPERRMGGRGAVSLQCMPRT